jgi:hypothetical protein
MFRSILKTIFRGPMLHKPPEDGLKNGPKHVEANFKCSYVF